MYTENVRPPVFLMIDSDKANCALIQQAFMTSAVASKLVVVNDDQMLIQYLAGQEEYANRVAFPMPSIILLALGIGNTSKVANCLSWLKGTTATRRLPVVILASVKNEEQMNQFYASGAAGYIIRPRLFSELLPMIYSLDDYWSHCARPGSTQLLLAIDIANLLGE